MSLNFFAIEQVKSVKAWETNAILAHMIFIGIGESKKIKLNKQY